MVTTTKTNETFDAAPRISSGSGASQLEVLSFAQERLWFLNQINPEDSAGNIARAVRIVVPLNREVLERSLPSLVYRHGSLRTTFATTELYAGIDSRPVELVANAGRFPLEFVDVNQTPEEAERVMRERL